MFYRLTSSCVEKKTLLMCQSGSPIPVRNPLFSSQNSCACSPWKEILLAQKISSSLPPLKTPMLVLPRKKLFSCVWIPLPKKKILCVLSAKKSSQRVFSAKYSSTCCSAKIVFLPIYMAAHSYGIFISLLEMCVDMSTHQILSTLTFLSKKN